MRSTRRTSLASPMGSGPPAFAGAGSRGQHDALDALAAGIENRAVNWILDADIKGFFDNISHEWMMRFVERRIGPRSGPMQRQAVSAPGDPRVLRLIRGWLKAGVVEDGVKHPATKGTPQGAVISPLLANIYRNYPGSWPLTHA